MSVNVTREKILQAAEDCFSQYGFDATSTRQLAKESGVNMSMLQYYFGNKEKLLETLLVSQSTIIMAELKPLAEMEGTSWERLEKMQHIIVEYSWIHRKLYKILMQELLLHQRQSLTEIAQQSFSDTFRIMRQVIVKGMENKEFRSDTDADLLISMVKGTLFFILNLQSSIMCEEVNIATSQERVHQFLTDILRRYLLC